MMCAVLWCFINAYDDPSSLFFKPSHAFNRVYSAIREDESAEFIYRVLLKVVSPDSKVSVTDRRNEQVCIGIPSVSGRHSTPLLHTLGTLSDTLTPEERDSIYIIVLLANENPYMHIAYGEPWLSQLADEVFTYNGSIFLGANPPHRKEPSEAYSVLAYNMHEQTILWSRVQKTKFDNSIVVEACRHRDAPYFALIQDNVVASRDWLKRLRAGIPEVRKRTEKSGRDWFYIRLFYSEMHMRWNKEEGLYYLWYIGKVYFVISCMLYLVLGLRLMLGWYTGANMTPANERAFYHFAALVLGTWTPAIVALAFAAGRVTLHRLTVSSGVREMPRYGCCAQGLVFPKEHLRELQEALNKPPYDSDVHVAIEGYANDNSLAKWALEPSVLQHVAMDDFSEGGKDPEVWNFSFERRR
jgi:hypothetical protein